MSPEAAIQAYNEQVRAENAKVAPHAIRAYNAKAGMYEAGLYEHVVKKRGGQLPEGFTIVKVRAPRLSCMSHPCLPSLASNPNGRPFGESCLIWQPST